MFVDEGLEQLERFVSAALGIAAGLRHDRAHEYHHRHHHHRALTVEELDSRVMLDASGNTAAFLNAVANDTSAVQSALVSAPSQQATTPAAATTPLVVSNGGTLSVHLSTTGLNVPASQLTFSLAGAPQGAQIDAQSGLLTWNVPVSFPTGPAVLKIVVSEPNGQSFTSPLVVTVTGFNGFDLFTTGAVELGGFAGGLAVDTGVNINGNLSVSPFGGSQPGALPAQPAALQQLAGIAPVTVGAGDLGLRLPAGIVDTVIGFDSGVPHNGEAMQELGRYGGSSGGGMSDQGVSPQKGSTEGTGSFDTFDGAPGSRNDSSKVERAKVPAQDATTFLPMPQQPALVEVPQPATQQPLSMPGTRLRFDLAPPPRVTEEAVAEAVAAQRRAAAVAVAITPLILPPPAARRYERRRKRLGRGLESLGQ